MKRELYTDAVLLEGISQGDTKAIAEVYRLYHKIWVRWLIGQGGQEADADDIFQDALLIVYEKAQLPEFCLTSKLSTYLFSIGKRLWYKKIGKYSKMDLKNEFGEDDLNTNEYEDAIQDFEEKETQLELLERALETLGEPCSSLLKAFYIDGLNMQEMAQKFNYTNADNAKNQKYKCLNRLKKIFTTINVSI